jgi:lysozyme
MLERGVDVSDWQGEIDFRALRAGGAAFVVSKLSEATSPTRLGRSNVEAAREAGLRVFGYHFLRAGGARGQAEAFARELLAVGLACERPYVDFEDDGSSVPSADDLLRFLRELPELGVLGRPLVYASVGKIVGAGLARRPEVAEVADLWLARWAASPGEVPAPWRADQVVLWQRGVGREPGIRGPVDEDVMVAEP